MEKGRDTLNLYFMCLHIFGLVPIKVLVKVVCIISLVLYTFLTVKHLKKTEVHKDKSFFRGLTRHHSGWFMYSFITINLYG